MAEKKMLNEKEIDSKIKDLKIELLKSPTKRARIKKEIARLLTMRNNEKVKKNMDEVKVDKTKTKSVEAGL